MTSSIRSCLHHSITALTQETPSHEEDLPDPGARSWGPGQTWHRLPHPCTSGILGEVKQLMPLWEGWGEPSEPYRSLCIASGLDTPPFHSSKPLQDPPRRAEAGTPLPAAIALSVGRSKRHVGQRPSVQLRLPRPTPSRRGRSRTASQLSGQGPGDKPYPKACGLQSRHRSSGPPSPFTRGEAEAQKE